MREPARRWWASGEPRQHRVRPGLAAQSSPGAEQSTGKPPCGRTISVSNRAARFRRVSLVDQAELIRISDVTRIYRPGSPALEMGAKDPHAPRVWQATPPCVRSKTARIVTGNRPSFFHHMPSARAGAGGEPGHARPVRALSSSPPPSLAPSMWAAGPSLAGCGARSSTHPCLHRPSQNDPAQPTCILSRSSKSSPPPARPAPPPLPSHSPHYLGPGPSVTAPLYSRCVSTGSDGEAPKGSPAAPRPEAH